MSAEIENMYQAIIYTAEQYLLNVRYSVKLIAKY